MTTQDMSGADRAGAIDRSPAGSRGSIGMVLLVAIALVGAAVGLLLVGRGYSGPYILALLAVLATLGVFALFALAAGLLRTVGEDAGHPMLKAVVDEAVDGLLVTDAHGRVVYANATYRNLTDAVDEADIRPVEQVFIGDPDVSEALFRLIKAAREGRRAQEEVRVSRRQDQAPSWLRLRVRPLGQAARTLWTVTDISRDRERQENAFHEFKHAIDFLDHAPAGFFSVDAQGHVTYLNATLAAWLDYDLAQVGSGGLKLADIVSNNGAALITTLTAAPGEVKTEALDLDFKTRTGRSLPVRLLHEVAFGADGTPGASRTLVLNRARGEAADPQRAAEVRFMRFFQSTPMAIATVDKTGKVARSNAQFARLFQSALKESGDARSIYAAISERDREALQAAIGQVAAGQSDVAPVDAALAGNGERWGRLYVSAVEDAERDAEAAIVYVLETTGQRTLENQVNQRARMESIGQLAGGIAHDFNNVLSAIMMATDFLLNAHKPTDPSFQDIMQIKQNANRAASLVRQLLAFSRRQTLRPQILDLGEVLGELTMLLRRLIGEKVALEVKHGRDLWPVKADVSQFEQVIVNLAVNARDAMPDGGKLTVRTANVALAEAAAYAYKGMPAADYVLVEVTDTGTGIAPEVMDKIFDGLRHRQADRRFRLSGIRARPRHHVPDLPAAPCAECGGKGPRAAACGRAGHRRDVGGDRAEARRRSHRAGRDPAGRGRGGASGSQRARPALARLYGARGRQWRRGDRGARRPRRPRRPGGVRRRDARDGRPDIAQGAAQEDPGDQDHLRFGLRRGRLREEPAGR
jgi:two-component system cell cycle sensor histidine kinase/response regulator CckA